MPALTAFARRADKGIYPWMQLQIPMVDNVVIYQGSIVMVGSAGTCRPATASASNLGCWGIGTGFGFGLLTNGNTVFLSDNTVTGHAVGAGNNAAPTGVWALVSEGVFLLPASVTIAISNNGTVVYAGTDNEVHLSQALNEPLAGIIQEFDSASTSWVRMSMEIAVGR